MKVPRYGVVMARVDLFLLEEEVDEFPLDVISLIQRKGWKLFTYSDVARHYNMAFEDVLAAAESQDGFTICEEGKYCIFYNDRVTSQGRIRFTLAHEIGHIVLRHFSYDVTRLSRNGLDDEVYEAMEREANTFARNLLAPAHVVTEICPPLPMRHALTEWFGLSNTAAQVRIERLEADESFPSNFVSKARAFIHRILYGQTCMKCGHYFIDASAKFCPVCGSTDIVHEPFNRRRDEYMIYSGYDLDEHGRPEVCPKCKNEEIDEGKYCKICGVFLINKCTSQSCGRIVSGNARYCSKCGGKTTYYVQELLDDWVWAKMTGTDVPEGVD